MKEIVHARSKKNGIIFYSNTIPQLAVDAFVNEDGKIETVTNLQVISDMINFFFEEESSHKFPSLIKYIIISLEILGVIALTVFFRNIALSLATIYCCFFAPSWFTLIRTAFKLKLGNQKQVARFHAAEHMVINAYCKLQRIPTLVEIKKFSRFSKSCGSMVLLEQVITASLFLICFAINSFVSPLIYLATVVVVTILVLVFHKFKLLKYFQIFFTSIPTNLELEVALKGIQAYDDMEKHIQQGEFEMILSDNCIIMPPFFKV